MDREVSVAALEERRAGAVDPAGPDAESPSADEAAAARLIARNRRVLLRVADPRARRQRAYALLARNGFDPGVCATLSARLVDGVEADAD